MKQIDFNKLGNEHPFERDLKGMLSHLQKVRNKSTANKRKVGAIVTDFELIGGASACNFIDAKISETCEDKSGETIPFVIHAEEEAIMTALKANIKLDKIFTTYSPCINCAKLIVNAGIRYVYFLEKHVTDFDINKFPNITVLEYLERSGLHVTQIINFELD